MQSYFVDWSSQFQRLLSSLPFILIGNAPMAEQSDTPPRLRNFSATKPSGICNAYLGHAQLSLVEHALCPLDAVHSLGRSFIFKTEYSFTDQNHHRKKAKVQVACPEGLSSADEFYLWGLLSLAFSQPQPAIDFYATPYYCLRQLGCIDPEKDRNGGKQFAIFRSSIRRLSTVSYRNDYFYDPIRGEHREVGFGFLSYSLPLDLRSSRAWRFAWDPIFYEFCQAASGALRFDFSTYRHLDPACRRLYLLLKKIFWRTPVSPEFDLYELSVDALGFSSTQPIWALKRKIVRCAKVLLANRIVSLPNDAASPRELIIRRAKGRYGIRFYRGSHFEEKDSPARTAEFSDSPLYEPLHVIGLDNAAIRHILKQYDSKLIAECADMTLAAKERLGENFFTNSPQAYFIDNLREQAAGRRTPPDWWRELRKEEERRRWQADRDERTANSTQKFEDAFDAYLKSEARESFDRVMDRIFQELRSGGQTESDARENAEHFARTHFAGRFRAEHPEWNNNGFSGFADTMNF